MLEPPVLGRLAARSSCTVETLDGLGLALTEAAVTMECCRGLLGL